MEKKTLSSLYGMTENEIINSLEYYVKRTPLATDYRSLETNVSIAIQGLLELYNKKKHDYLVLQAFYSKDYIRKDKIKEKIEELEIANVEMTVYCGARQNGKTLQTFQQAVRCEILRYLRELLEEN